MSSATIEENTLGVAVGREGRHRQEKRRRDNRGGFRRSERTVKTTRAYQSSSLGGRHLGVGMMFCGGVIAVFLLWRFALQWTTYPSPLLSLAAWVVFTAAIVAGFVARHRSTGMPPWLFTAALATGAVTVLLDLAGSHGLSSLDIHPTAAPAVGALLLSFVTVRETREILVATGVLGSLMAAAALAEDRTDPSSLAPDILTIALGVLPPLLGIAIVRAFRRMVQLELDLVLVQSTVSQPGFAVGMLASEQLARLDLAAERLLDDVAEARTPLPLAPAMSNTAASLATQLRLHLIEGRKETWLHHAVTESEFLGPSVQVNDPNGLAGLLAPVQRDALLRTIWLLISDATRTAATVSLTLGPISPTHGIASRKRMRFPVELITTGVPRRGVDPETWQAIRVLGPHVDSIRDGSLRVDIECSVDNPADA